AGPGGRPFTFGRLNEEDTMSNPNPNVAPTALAVHLCRFLSALETARQHGDALLDLLDAEDPHLPLRALGGHPPCAVQLPHLPATPRPRPASPLPQPPGPRRPPGQRAPRSPRPEAPPPPPPPPGGPPAVRRPAPAPPRQQRERPRHRRPGGRQRPRRAGAGAG